MPLLSSTALLLPIVPTTLLVVAVEVEAITALYPTQVAPPTQEVEVLAINTTAVLGALALTTAKVVVAVTLAEAQDIKGFC